MGESRKYYPWQQGVNYVNFIRCQLKTTSSCTMNIETPCIGICSTVYGDDICRGCRRFADEIIEWNGFEPEKKEVVLKRLAKFTETVMRDKIKAIDEVVLRQKLDDLGVRYVEAHGPYCWVYGLLRAYAFKIKDLSKYGVTLFPSQCGVNLKELLVTIDEELYELSERSFSER